MSIRRDQAYNIRVKAADIARSRPHDTHKANGDEQRYFKENSNDLSYIAAYTKGLPHNRRTGVLHSPRHFELFVRGINTGNVNDFKEIPLGPQKSPENNLFGSGIAGPNPIDGEPTKVRAWESMGAGLVHDLEGPDSQAITMPPNPALESDELAAEMTENYWMALLRDVRFSDFDTNDMVKDAIESLNNTTWVKNAQNPPQSITMEERKRLRGPFTDRTVFRGNTLGDDVGPYISQFLLTGTAGLNTAGLDNFHDPSEGYIQYGAMRMDQRVRIAKRGLDYMTTWEAYLDVQNGADLRGRDTYESGGDGYRFITTPRDLATYVHHDALYQAYLNACIIMLDMNVPFDEGIPFQGDDARDKQQGFAHFGGPHILTLVTEVATRALKAVRFQKFNTHRRLRPEAIGGLIERFHHDSERMVFAGVKPLYDALDKDMLGLVRNHNKRQNRRSDFGRPRRQDFHPAAGRNMRDSCLLPMAFPEGSPMHPAYGAGHATVAGACVTILKAFFNTTYELPHTFVPNANGMSLNEIKGKKLTVEGELNKLCSNISIGRNWAGVHYFTDYRESILLGEKIAIGILEEQKITFPERFSMTLTKFDGEKCTISNRN